MDKFFSKSAPASTKEYNAPQDKDVQESKERRYRKNIFVDDCAVSDEEYIDSTESEDLSSEGLNFAKGLIDEEIDSDESEREAHNQKLHVALSLKSDDEFLRRFEARFGAFKASSEDDAPIDLKSVVIPVKRGPRKLKIRKTEKEDFGDISEEDDINQSPSLKQKKWKIMAKLKDSGGGMVADIFSDELSLEALSNIKRPEWSSHLVPDEKNSVPKKAKGPGTRKMQKFAFFIDNAPQKAESSGESSKVKGFAKTRLKNSRTIGKYRMMKGTTNKKSRAKRKTFCVFSTSSRTGVFEQ